MSAIADPAYDLYRHARDGATGLNFAISQIETLAHSLIHDYGENLTSHDGARVNEMDRLADLLGSAMEQAARCVQDAVYICAEAIQIAQQVDR